MRLPCKSAPITWRKKCFLLKLIKKKLLLKFMLFNLSEHDIFHYLILGVLLFCSLYSWTVIFAKMLQVNRFQRLLKKNAEILHCFDQHEWKHWHKKIVAQGHESFLHRIYDRVQQLINEDIKNEAWTEQAYQYLSLYLQEEQQRCQKGLSSLVSIANVSPYIGLLGTLVSLMQTFEVMGLQSSRGGFDSIGSGIVLALKASVCGLLVAIPAHLAYNKFVTQSQQQVRTLGRQSEYLLLHLQSSVRKLPDEIIC